MDKNVDLSKPIPAECYYIKESVHGWWAYFTITPAIGLLQIHCDFGTFTDHFADRWGAPGPDFKRFLTEGSVSYFANAIEATASQYDDRATQKARGNLQRRLKMVMLHLWPLFIERLKMEIVLTTKED
jgi:hypothetical protein